MTDLLHTLTRDNQDAHDHMPTGDQIGEISQGRSARMTIKHLSIPPLLQTAAGLLVHLVHYCDAFHHYNSLLDPMLAPAMRHSDGATVPVLVT